jgi:hypothetical protein
MGKKAKEHRKKVAKRNRIIQQERKRFEKQSQELFNQIYNEQMGSTKPLESSFNFPNMNGPLIVPQTEPIINSTILNGPQI